MDVRNRYSKYKIKYEKKYNITDTIQVIQIIK